MTDEYTREIWNSLGDQCYHLNLNDVIDCKSWTKICVISCEPLPSSWIVWCLLDTTVGVWGNLRCSCQSCQIKSRNANAKWMHQYAGEWTSDILFLLPIRLCNTIRCGRRWYIRTSPCYQFIFQTFFYDFCRVFKGDADPVSTALLCPPFYYDLWSSDFRPKKFSGESIILRSPVTCYCVSI